MQGLQETRDAGDGVESGLEVLRDGQAHPEPFRLFAAHPRPLFSLERLEKMLSFERNGINRALSCISCDL